MADHHQEDEETTPLLSSSKSLSSRFSTLLSSPSSLNGLEKALIAASVFFLLLTATGFGLFVGEVVKVGQGKGQQDGGATTTQTATSTTTATATVTHTLPLPTPTTPSSKEVCLTSTCVTVASTIITGLDKEVDPCENFYEFANGGWLKNNPIPEGKGFFGAAQDIGERNKRTILSILSTPPSTSLPQADQNNLHHLQDFHSSCLDEDLLDRTGLSPFLSVVNEVLSAWRGKGKWDSTTRKDRLTSTLSWLHSRAIPSLFKVYPEGDVKNDPSHLILWLAQDGLGLPSKDYYEDVDTVEVYKEVVRASLGEIYTALGEVEGVDLKAVAKAVVGLEKKLAEVGLDPEELESPNLTYNPLNSSTLHTTFPYISFKNYFASYTPRPDYPDPVIVTSPSYLEEAGKLIDGAEEDVLEGYFLTRIVEALGPLLGAKTTIAKEILWLSNYLGGIPEGVKPSRSDICYQSLLNNYGFLIGRYYVQKSFAGDSKDYAEEVIVATIEAFKNRLPELEWLDKVTRERAEEKASAITHKIGYPTNPNTEDPAALERYYSINLPITSKDYFGNVLRSKLAEQRRSWVTVGGRQDKGRWDMIPSEVNAYYSPPANEIAFPAGILQSPYFSKDWPEYLAFGAFGSVAGHELTHAFDQMGRLYDKDGKLSDWWTNGTVTRFTELQQCLLDQYANYTILDPQGNPIPIKSTFTNGEDMADGGGLSQSFRAWKDRFESDKDGDKFDNYLLPGLEFSREQMFFIGYAQGWARNIKPAEAVKRIRTDPHSPTNYRVIGPLSNDENFSKAFGCKAGQPMSNVNKCHVW